VSVSIVVVILGGVLVGLVANKLFAIA